MATFRFVYMLKLHVTAATKFPNFVLGTFSMVSTASDNANSNFRIVRQGKSNIGFTVFFEKHCSRMTKIYVGVFLLNLCKHELDIWTQQLIPACFNRQEIVNVQ